MFLVKDTLCIPEQPLQVDRLLYVLLPTLDDLTPQHLHMERVRASTSYISDCHRTASSAKLLCVIRQYSQDKG